MLIREIELFLREKRMPATKFGRLATTMPGKPEGSGDPRFVLDLRNGRTPRDETAERVRSFMDGYAA